MFLHRNLPPSPYINRFLQPDTLIPDLSNPQGWNRYSYVTNRPVNFNDPTGHMMDQGDEGGCTDEVDCALQTEGDPATPWDVGVEWLTGKGHRHHDFQDGDPFTELLQQHEHLDEVRDEIAIRLSEGNYQPGTGDYWLGGLDGMWKYLVDYSTLLTFGQTGNLAVTFLGSYDLNYYVVSVNPDDGTAVVMINVENESTLAFATHPPVIGYTDFWLDTIAPMTNSLVQSGPMSEVTRSFWWTETIYYK